MKLHDFYKKALDTLSLDVDKEGYVTVKVDEEDLRVTVGSKKFLVMATSDHVSTMDDNKILFNPLQEDSIKGINPSMVKYKAMLERQLSISFNVIQKLLAKLASDIKLQKDASLELNKFISKLNQLRKPNMKEIVTEETIRLLNRVHDLSYQKASNAGMISVSLARGKVIDGEKFNKVATVHLPVYLDVLENPKYIYDIEIKRSADAGIFKIMTEYIIGTNDDEEIDYARYTIGSNSLDSPTFISTYKLYFKLAERFNKILKQLSYLDKDLCEASLLKTELALDDLIHIESFKSQLRLIPKISDNSSLRMLDKASDNKSYSAPHIAKGISASNMPASKPMTILQQEIIASREPIAPAAPQGPLSAMQRKLIEMRGGTIPAQSYGRQDMHRNVSNSSLITLRQPGAVPPMDPRLVARLNQAAAGLARMEPEPIYYSSQEGAIMNPAYYNRNGQDRSYTPYMRQ